MSLFLDSIFSSIALSHFMVDTFNASRPVLLTYLGLSEWEIALFSTIYIWTSALTQPFFGWISDRMGPRWLAAGGVLWMAVFYSAALFFPGKHRLGMFDNCRPGIVRLSPGWYRPSHPARTRSS
jgi:MFS family permease